jgi:hypothetical protein
VAISAVLVKVEAGTPADRDGCVDVWGVRDGSSSCSGETDIDCSFGISPLLQDLHKNVKLVKLV